MNGYVFALALVTFKFSAEADYNDLTALTFALA